MVRSAQSYSEFKCNMKSKLYVHCAFCLKSTKTNWHKHFFMLILHRDKENSSSFFEPMKKTHPQAQRFLFHKNGSIITCVHHHLKCMNTVLEFPQNPSTSKILEKVIRVTVKHHVVMFIFKVLCGSCCIIYMATVYSPFGGEILSLK